jgi:hypothetical protein
MPATESETVQKKFKLVQRIRPGNLPGPSRPLFGARLATFTPPAIFLVLFR